MNKIVNGVANDYEFPNLYDPNISYSKAYTEQLLAEKDKEIERLNNIIDELEKYHIKSMENLKNTEDFKYVGVNHIKILYEEHKRTLDRIKELKEGKQ